jgi:lysophospholipase L1-like esterase
VVDPLSGNDRPPGARRALARFAGPVGGLVFGAFLIFALETALGLLGVGGGPARDPFAGLAGEPPLFEAAAREDGTRVLRLSPSRRIDAPHPGALEPQREFLAEKPAGAFRIFVIGESSAQGTPYGPRYAFSSWMQRRLEAALPDLRVEVVNAALAGYASRRLLPIAREIAAHSPDLLVVYMGHNEWAERKYYEHLLRIDPRLLRVLGWASRTRTYALLSQLARDGPLPGRAASIDLGPRENAAEMFAVLRDRVGGIAIPSQRELAYRDLLYESNLEQMIEAMRGAGAQVALLTLSQNFSGWPPPASTHRPDLGAAEQARWREHFEAGRRLAETDCAAALAAWERALEVDGEYAELHYRVAGCQQELGRLEEAWWHYRRASDLDRVPHGAPTGFNEILRRLALRHAAILVDVDAALREESGAALVGDDLFTDFAHPRIRAHQRIAREVVLALRQHDLPVRSALWREGGYADPAPEALTRDDPQLLALELQSRVVTCLVAPRAACHSEARELQQRDPGNQVATWVLGRSSSPGEAPPYTGSRAMQRERGSSR